MKKLALGLLMVQLIGVGAAGAQTAKEMEIRVEVYERKTSGAEERAGGYYGIGAADTKTTGAGRFSVGECGAFLISAGGEGPFGDGSTTGWRVEITPITVVTGAVTFRLRWVRALDTSMTMVPKSEDVELTMRPGDSRPMDTVSVPPEKGTGRRCPVTDSRGQSVELTHVSLHVSVQLAPGEERERRLMAADLWLIERLPNGTERVQAQSVRGLPHREIPFFFDAITEGALSLEVVGQVIARPYGSTIEVRLSTRPRWGPAAFDWRDGKSHMRYVDSRLDVKPGETIEVALPQLENSAGPFASRKYAIRVRARQLR
jgi:hypothetical protein